MLLDTAGLAGASDAVRLAVLVLASRTPSETGVVEIRTSELGRWIGMSASYTASEVVPGLRRSGVVSVETAEGEYGQDDGLECKVLPLWAAQDVVKHPLNLAKKEYATLQRLFEAVMAPGWKHRDGRVTPAGLIGTRTGRGAATDRLALLLLVLEAQETGRVRQCGGTVDTKRGRAAATVARLLGCTASAGERVLERLEDRELVLRVRLKTGSGLRNRSRLMVPAVAAAHGRTVADDVQEDRAQAPESKFSDPDVAAGAGEAPETETEPQVSVVPVTDVADVAEPDVAAALHTDHPHLVTSASSLALSGGFSGEGRGGEGRRPERGCVREDQPVDGAGTAAGSASPVAEGGPLRGEQLEKASITNRTKPDCGDLAAVEAPSADTAGPGTRGRATLPPLDVRGVLGPVRWLWAKIERSGARTSVVRRTRAALDELAEIVGPDQAAPALTARLTRRLHNQGGEALVTDPAAWIIGRGLPQQHTGCGDARCDDGHRLDTNTGCEACADRHADRQALRRQAAATIDARHPHLTGAARRTAIEDHLHTEVQHAALLRQARHDRQAAEREARRTGAPLPALRAWPGRDEPSGKSTCRECGARIVLAGPAAQDLLCGACHRESTTLAARSSAATPASTTPSACTQTDRRGRPCSRPPVPDHDVCVRHLAHALTGRPSS
ncbi:hypothetical protein [Streptomyces sp. NBU3104]|uniref:hypothetical protein n=1 Tax=Streptomyces sp. NBU3104 TaxID=2911367 RepID=UPI001EDC4CE3|nr:hypothetical protein [Streptomyces sp. NBU3104]UKL07446.1 hypothetical protein L2I08_30865 [Streptomyces sp. NBU3104]